MFLTLHKLANVLTKSINKPVQLIVRINKYKFSASKINPIVCQVEQGRVVEVWIRLSVDVQVPVLVMDRGGGLRVQT